MVVFRSIVFAAVLSGLLVGSFATIAQHIAIVPLIVQAEVYEQQAHNEQHEDEVWQPANGFERSTYTALFNLVDWIGFALLLNGALVLMHRPVTWREGYLWGLGAFVAFVIAPGLGLPPEAYSPAIATTAMVDRDRHGDRVAIGCCRCSSHPVDRSTALCGGAAARACEHQRPQVPVASIRRRRHADRAAMLGAAGWARLATSIAGSPATLPECCQADVRSWDRLTTSRATDLGRSRSFVGLPTNAGAVDMSATACSLEVQCPLTGPSLAHPGRTGACPSRLVCHWMIAAQWNGRPVWRLVGIRPQGVRSGFHPCLCTTKA